MRLTISILMSTKEHITNLANLARAVSFPRSYARRAGIACEVERVNAISIVRTREKRKAYKYD